MFADGFCVVGYADSLLDVITDHDRQLIFVLRSVTLLSMLSCSSSGSQRLLSSDMWLWTLGPEGSP